MSPEKIKHFRKLQKQQRFWHYEAYRQASLAGMGSECTSGVARGASRSVPGALRERAGAPREHPKRGHPSCHAQRDSMKSTKNNIISKVVSRKNKIFQKNTNLTPFLAVWGVPTGLFGQKGLRRRRRGASGSVRGATCVARLYRYLSKLQNISTFLKICEKQKPAGLVA